MSLVAFAIVGALGGPPEATPTRDHHARAVEVAEKAARGKRTKKRRASKKKRTRPAPAAARATAPTPEVVPTTAPVATASPTSPPPGTRAEPSDTLALGTTLPSGASVRTTPLVRVRVDGRPFMRQLRYRDDIRQDLRSYDLSANAVGLMLAVAPVRTVPALGFEARGELTVGVDGSRGPDMELYATRSFEWTAAVSYAVSRGPVDLGVQLGGGEHRFTIDDAMSPRGELVPDTTYRFVRGGMTASMPVSRAVTARAEAGWRHLVSTGGLASEAWFPNVTGAGIDAALGVELDVGAGFRVYARGELRRYFFALNPEVGDPLIVGGALDQYLGLAAGLGFDLR